MNFIDKQNRLTEKERIFLTRDKKFF